MAGIVRVAALQPRRRLIDWKLDHAEEVFARVEENLDALSALLVRAAEGGCRAVCYPESMLGLAPWLAAHPEQAGGLLPRATGMLLARLRDLARRWGLYVVGCEDFPEPDGVYNTAVLLGPDGGEIGRYRKVHLPLQEQNKRRGTRFPVFETPDLGTVGLCICYDMVFPETTRALALAGASLVFHPTLGGAAMGDGDVSRAAFRTRAVDNGLYIVSAERGGGSLILGPKGQVLADGGKEPDAIVTADIDPGQGRDLGDALGGLYPDLRARLFRERVPAAYGILREPEPAFVASLPPIPPAAEVSRVAAGASTVGEEQFSEADRLLREGRTDEAASRFAQLQERYPTTWIRQESAARLEWIRSGGPSAVSG